MIAVDFTAADRRKTVATTFPSYSGQRVVAAGLLRRSVQVRDEAAHAAEGEHGLRARGRIPRPSTRACCRTAAAIANRDDPDTWWILESTFITNAGPPCVQSRTRLPNGDAVITSIWPSGADVGSTADPRGRS